MLHMLSVAFALLLVVPPRIATADPIRRLLLLPNCRTRSAATIRSGSPIICTAGDLFRQDDAGHSQQGLVLQHYASVIGPELKANVLKQDPNDYFNNYQGVMIGDGCRNIWFDNFGDEAAGTPTRFEIITINDSD